MKIIGCDFHTRYQQIAMMDEATGRADRAAAGARERRGPSVLRQLAEASAGGHGSDRPRAVVRAHAGRMRARTVGRPRQRDSRGRGAEAEDGRARRRALAAICCCRSGFRAFGFRLSAERDTRQLLRHRLQAGLFSNFGEEPVARAGHEPGRVPEEEVVHGQGARGVGKTLARSVGQPAASGVVRYARSVQSVD